MTPFETTTLAASSSYQPRAALDPREVRGQMDGVLRADPLDPGRIDAFLPSPVVQNHAANLMELAGGDLACVWFGGSMEGKSDICVYFSRLPRGGARWTEPERLSDDLALSEQNPVLFNAPDGRLWLFFTAQPAGNQDAAIVRFRISDDGGRSFGPVEVLPTEAGTFVRQPPIVAPNGDWLLPVFRCRSEGGRKWSGDHDDSAVLVSSDGGRSWSVRPVPDSLGCVHMNIVAGADGAAVADYRSRWADNIHWSRSGDGGRSWSAPERSVLPNNNASIQMIRLRSGRLALVYNHASAADAAERRTSLYDELGRAAGSGGTGAPPPALAQRGRRPRPAPPGRAAVFCGGRTPAALRRAMASP